MDQRIKNKVALEAYDLTFAQCHQATLPRNGKRMPFIAEKLRLTAS